jgi:hypothetical protein
MPEDVPAAILDAGEAVLSWYRSEAFPKWYENHAIFETPDRALVREMWRAMLKAHIFGQRRVVYDETGPFCT